MVSTIYHTDTEDSSLTSRSPILQFITNPRFEIIRQSLFITTTLIVMVGLLFFGFKYNFPGNALSRYLERLVSEKINVPVRIAPVELNWNSVNVPEITVLSAKPIGPAKLTKLVSLQNIEISPWTLALTRSVQLKTDAYGGKIALHAPFDPDEKISFSIKDLTVENIPLMNVVPYAFIKGNLSISGAIENPAIFEGQAPIPKGTVVAKATNIIVQLKNLENVLPGVQIPNITLSEIILNAGLGPTVAIKQLKLSGDLDGLITGVIQLNPKRMPTSRINLNVRIKFNAEILKTLSQFQFLLQQFQCGDAIDVEIVGTLENIGMPKKRKCEE